MRKLFNLPTQKSVRQTLRNRMTVAEKKLWYYLKGSHLEGYKFRRQQGIGPYVVDFYCPQRRLAIEIDGDSHYQRGAAGRDYARQRFIEAQEIRVLRFTDNDVRESLSNILEIILKELRAISDRTTPNPSSERRGND